LKGPFELLSTGNCGSKIHWFGCDTDSAHACYQAVEAEPQCTKDYFTFNSRGDQNCGCKTSNEEVLVVYSSDLGDCYKITSNDAPTPTED